MIDKKLPLITCPVCGREYMPGEIYLPKSFFGKQTEVVRNNEGKIEFFLGDDMDLWEEFVCEDCLTKMKIKANLTFEVTAIKNDFDEEYTTEINKPAKIKLSEEAIF